MNATTRTYTLALATLWLATAGCSGGSGGGARDAPAMPVAQPTTPKPTARGTLVVTVTDLLGAPVPGARIDVSSKWPDEHKSAMADANGRAEVTGVIDDAVTIRATAADQHGYPNEGHLNLPSLGGQRMVNAYVEIEPALVAPILGITNAQVVAGGVRDDGRTLEVSLGLLGLGDAASPRILDCVPDTANDGSRFQPDCMAGAEGFDAPYAVLNNGLPLASSRVVVCCYDGIWAPSLSSTLLLDQSGTVISSDPGDYRLFAAKYFLTWGKLDRRVSLAAFAANDAASGQPALLPQQPLTIFPVENPVVGAAGRELFPVVDALGSLEGGGAPLYDALDRLIDLAAPGPDEISTIFVITDGRDTTCGTYSQCKERRRQVLQKSRERKVTITTIGASAGATGADREALGALSQGSHNGDRAAFWGSYSSHLPATLRAALLNQRWPENRRDATFQIQAPRAGTFASGRTVIGTIRIRVCPEFCGDVDVPFTVEIP
jgi:hypothetical protein